MIVTNSFFVKLRDKRIAVVRTESGRFFEITDCQPSTYNKRGINLHGVLKNAKQVTPEYVADLLTKGATLIFKKKAKRRATSKTRHSIRQLVSTLREEAV